MGPEDQRNEVGDFACKRRRKHCGSARGTRFLPARDSAEVPCACRQLTTCLSSQALRCQLSLLRPAWPTAPACLQAQRPSGFEPPSASGSSLGAGGFSSSSGGSSPQEWSQQQYQQPPAFEAEPMVFAPDLDFPPVVR